jgi:hypothetical protein
MPHHPLPSLRRLRLMAAALWTLAGLLNLAACEQKTPALASPAATPAPATPPASSAASAATPTRANLEAEYKSCPEGYYSGPRPGRVRYTKDDYLWVVTPEFAAAYCMPPEFVDKSLKGVEAIAYKPVYAGYENCGFGGIKEACSRAMSHGFEIYYKCSLKLPSISDTKYSHSVPYMLSRSDGLLTPKKTRTDKELDAWKAERPGIQNKFPGWGLVGVKGPKPMWPIVHLYQVQYAEDILPGYNYISLEGSMGFFTNPRMEKLGLTEFVVILDRPMDMRKDEEKDLRTDYGHVIHLPPALLDKVRQVDKAGRAAFDQLLDKALPEQRR